MLFSKSLSLSSGNSFLESGYNVRRRERTSFVRRAHVVESLISGAGSFG